MPKNNNKIIFTSIPDYSDNSLVLYEWMLSTNQFDKKKFYWFVNNPSYYSNTERTRFIKMPSTRKSVAYIRYLYHIFTAKYLFVTHGTFEEANPKRQKCVCLWHGTMLKKVGALNEEEKGRFKGYSQFSHITIASDYYVDIFSRCFRCNRNIIKVTGSARCDLLFYSSNVLTELKISIQNDHKIIVYMPTFRTSKLGGVSDIENPVSEKLISFNNLDALRELSEELQRNKLYMFVKWHPLDVHQEITTGWPNIIFIDNNILEKKMIHFYRVLHYADALITDYSGVFCDYMMLDRPIAFDITDIDEYASKRGFVFDNPLDYMPGYKLKNKKDLYEFFSDVSTGLDKSKDLRYSLYSIYNNYNDGNSRDRILDLVF